MGRDRAYQSRAWRVTTLGRREARTVRRGSRVARATRYAVEFRCVLACPILAAREQGDSRFARGDAYSTRHPSIPVSTRFMRRTEIASGGLPNERPFRVRSSPFVAVRKMLRPLEAVRRHSKTETTSGRANDFETDTKEQELTPNGTTSGCLYSNLNPLEGLPPDRPSPRAQLDQSMPRFRHRRARAPRPQTSSDHAAPPRTADREAVSP